MEEQKFNRKNEQRQYKYMGKFMYDCLYNIAIMSYVM